MFQNIFCIYSAGTFNKISVVARSGLGRTDIINKIIIRLTKASSLPGFITILVWYKREQYMASTVS